jgi:GntR family transcriptional regulator of vanillate catabolism
MSRVSGLVERVRLMILRGEIPAGGRIVELHLAETFRISRSTVREVLRQLEGHGLLEANESGGMRVVALDARELAGTLEVRGALEALSARLAAARIADGRIASAAVRALGGLADAADAALRGGAPADAVLADRAFHRALDALAANRAGHDALDRLWDRIVVATSAPAARRQPAELADRDHRELLAAVAAGDGAHAAAIAQRHALAALV